MNGFEIERKFLVKNDDWKKQVKSTKSLTQIYLSSDLFHCVFHRSTEEDKLSLEVHNEDHVFKVDIDKETKSLILGNSLVNFDKNNDFNINNSDWITRLRVEVCNGTTTAEITVKGPHSGITKPEYNFQVNYEDIYPLFNSKDSQFCHRIIKKRHIIDTNEEGIFWEVDEFESPKTVEGLILAEIEIPNVDHTFLKPEWLGKDVSENPKYFNKNMI